jgi:hypothetical protein
MSSLSLSHTHTRSLIRDSPPDQEQEDKDRYGRSSAQGRAPLVPQRHPHPEQVSSLLATRRADVSHSGACAFAIDSLDDLYSLLCFLHVPVVSDLDWWNTYVVKPSKAKTTSTYQCMLACVSVCGGERVCVCAIVV